MEQFTDDQYTSIIPTAFLTAYPRTLTDIPYSHEIFEQLGRLRQANGDPELPDDLKVPTLAPELEARCKLIDKCLAVSGIRQVLELAAGLSPRGMIMTADADVQYAELDLREMAAMKQEIVGSVIAAPQNLHVVAGNALRVDDLGRAVKDFDIAKPLAVINEGLLRYLTFPEKAQVARNIYTLLDRFGGVWITHDATPKKLLAAQNAAMPGMNDALVSMTGKDFNNISFESEAHARNFFADLGFAIETHHVDEIMNELMSPEKLRLSKDEIRRMIGAGLVFVMSIAK